MLFLDSYNTQYSSMLIMIIYYTSIFLTNNNISPISEQLTWVEHVHFFYNNNVFVRVWSFSSTIHVVGVQLLSWSCEWTICGIWVTWLDEWSVVSSIIIQSAISVKVKGQPWQAMDARRGQHFSTLQETFIRVYYTILYHIILNHRTWCTIYHNSKIKPGISYP